MRSWRIPLGGLVGLALLFPYLTLIFQVGSWSLPVEEAAGVFAFTFVQAIASAFVSLAAGVAGALGLIWLAESLPRHQVRFAEAFVLLPNAVPVLLLLLACLKFFPWAQGFVGIVFVHVLLNAGLVAVAVVSLIQSRIGAMAELAWVEGATKSKFFFRIALPLLRAEFMTLALFVFAICFASFAVPLVLGGSGATTVETLIYQKIRMNGAWGQAVALASLQAAIIFATAWFLRLRATPIHLARLTRLPILAWKWGVIFVAIPSFILLAGLLTGIASGLGQLSKLTDFRAELPGLIIGSSIVGFGTGAVCIALLALIAFVDPKGLARRALLGYAAPSAVLTGFAILFFWRATGVATYFKIIAGLSLATIPSFYRLQWDSVLVALEGQRTVARTMGAGEGMIFTKIVWPQVAEAAFRIAGLASVWAWGDFGLSSVVGERSITLAMVTQGLMGSYRMDAATVMVWIILAGATLTYLAFAGVGRVLGSQSQR